MAAKRESIGTRNLRDDTLQASGVILRTILNIRQPRPSVKSCASPRCVLFLIEAAWLLLAHPRRIQPPYSRIHRAAFDVGARQIAGADQKLACDLAAREYKRLLEQLYPLRFVERMIRVQ